MMTIVTASIVTSSFSLTGCVARDAAPDADSASTASQDSIRSTERARQENASQPITPGLYPPVSDTAAIEARPRQDMPPVAGETKKPPPLDRRERDSATDPVLEIGEDGKVRPIKR